MDYLRVCVDYRPSDRVANIRCPTLVRQAESEVAAYAGRLYDALTGPKTFIRFTTAKGELLTHRKLPIAIENDLRATKQRSPRRSCRPSWSASPRR